jgi:hypothetical protein
MSEDGDDTIPCAQASGVTLAVITADPTAVGMGSGGRNSFGTIR